MSKLTKTDLSGHLAAVRSRSQLCVHRLNVCLILFVTSILYLSPTAYSAPSDLPLISIEDMKYKGAFRLPAGEYGTSSANYSRATIGYNGDNNSIFVTGHDGQKSIAEFAIPALVNSTNLADLNVAPAPRQNFSKLVSRGEGAFGDLGIQASGMLQVNGELIVNIYEYFDTPPFNQLTTMVVHDSDNIATGEIGGYFEMGGLARAAGWMSLIPPEWQSELGGSHLSGFSSGNTRTIITRFSPGPSAFVFNPLDIVDNPSPNHQIQTTELLGYTVDKGLVPETALNNNDLTNKLWTHISEAAFGMIIPGTRTYFVIGFSGGHESGISYGVPPYGGVKSFYTKAESDVYNYYWLYDVNELVKVKNGQMNPHDVRPYAYGAVDIPFQGAHRYNNFHYVAGGSYDSNTGTMYLSGWKADSSDQYANPPVITAFQFSTDGSSVSAVPVSDPDPVVLSPPDAPSSLQVTVIGPASGATVSDSCLGAPALAAPTGTIVNVSTEAELQSAVKNLADNTTIVLAPGNYSLSSTLYVRKNYVTITGQTDSCEDVVLSGKGMDNASYGNVPHGIWTDSLNLSVRNLTIRDVYYHTIVFNPGAEEPHVYNVKLLNSGEQFIKANSSSATSSSGEGVDGGFVGYTTMEYTNAPPSTDHGGGTGYTNGVDVLGGENWVIRNNLFKNIHNPDSAMHHWAPAILIWRGGANTLSDSNVFIDCDRAIAYGLEDDSLGKSHSGGIIRNNMIYYSSGLFSSGRKAESDGAIIVWDSPQTKVLHNSVLTNGNLNKSIEFRFDTSGAEVKNNLLDAPIGGRNEAVYVSDGNLYSATSSMFVAPGSGDLHLKSTATAAINKVSAPTGALNDIDGHSRSSSGNDDVGADEYY